MANHFFIKLKKKYKKQINSISNEAIKALNNYAWPGNIRELEHIIERAVIISDNQNMELEDLHFSTKKSNDTVALSLNLEETEKVLIQKALDKHQGNISKASKELGLTRAALYRRLEKFGL